MKYKITKTDRRHNAHNVMKYIVEVDWDLGDSKDARIQFFKDTRAWLWENYGPGCELKFVTIKLGTTSIVAEEEKSSYGINTVERWAWDTEFGHQRIYIKSDAEMTFFRLKFT